MAFVIGDSCVACGACAGSCPVGAISEGDGKFEIDADSCISCDLVQVHAQQEQFQKSNFHKKEPYGSFFIAFIFLFIKSFIEIRSTIIPKRILPPDFMNHIRIYIDHHKIGFAMYFGKPFS